MIDPAVSQNIKKGLDKAKGVGMPGHMINMAFTYFDYKSRLSSGQNPLLAMGAAGITGFLGVTMGAVPFLITTMGYSALKAGSKALYTNYHNYNNYTRRISTPFSHSYTHTDSTMKAQMRGLQAMGASSGFAGAEAGMMHQLYGRR